MKNIILTSIYLFTAVVFSQTQGSIRDTVTDNALNNEPLLFANIQLKGFSSNQQTNFHGNFEISNINPGEYILKISYAGYETEEVNLIVVENRISEIEINLSPIEINFDDVVGMNITSKEDNLLVAEGEKIK